MHKSLMTKEMKSLKQGARLLKFGRRNVEYRLKHHLNDAYAKSQKRLKQLALKANNKTATSQKHS